MQLLQALASRISLLDEEFDLEAILALLTTLRTNAPLTDLPTLLQVVGAAANASVSATVLAPRASRSTRASSRGPDGAHVHVANVPEMRGYVQSVMGN